MRIKIIINEAHHFAIKYYKFDYIQGLIARRPYYGDNYHSTYRYICEETNNPSDLKINESNCWATFLHTSPIQFIKPNGKTTNCYIYNNFFDLSLPKKCDNSFKEKIIKDLEVELNKNFKNGGINLVACKKISSKSINLLIDTEHYKKNITARFFYKKGLGCDVGKLLAPHIDLIDAKNLSLTCKELAKDISLMMRK